jgi:16S rRNA (uracil1498-N3)-methyltransferase
MAVMKYIKKYSEILQGSPDGRQRRLGEVAGAAGALLVGPEGGWDPGERRDLLAAGWRPVHLGERVLRLETAALAGAALLLLTVPRMECDG